MYFSLTTGHAFGGIFAATLNILMLTIGSSAVSAAFYDFLIIILVEVISVALFILLTRTEFYKHYAGDENSGHDFSVETMKKNNQETKLSLIEIYKKIWVWILAIFITFVTFMTIFPAITSQVVSTGSGAR